MASGKEQLDRELFIYMASLIHNGTYNYGIKWKDFYTTFSGISSSDPRKICNDLVNEGYVESSGDDEPFMVISRMDIHASDNTVNRVYDAVKNDTASYNLAVCYSIEPSLVESILSASYFGSYDLMESPVAKTLVPICTSGEFQKDSRVYSKIKESVSGWSRDLAGINSLISIPWFYDLLFILRNGKYGNGGFNYIENMGQADRDQFLKGTVSIINSGVLVTVLLAFGKILSREDINKNFVNYTHRTHRKKRVSRIYAYLSIGNDIMVGLEFLTGSFEFLPKQNELIGVYLFIAGSSQLLIRPIIEIARRIHLYRINRAKITLQ